MEALVKLNAQIDKKIDIQDKGAVGRQVHRFIDKAIAAAVALFISW